MCIIVRFVYILFLLATSIKATKTDASSCRYRPRWPLEFKMEDIFGMWFAVEMAQHAPDLTDKPDRPGCLMLHVVGFADEPDLPAPLLQEDAVQNLTYLKPYTWRGKRNYRPKRANLISQKGRLTLLWDEEGQPLVQIYLYSYEDPTVWVAQQAEDEPWYPYARTRREETIYILKATSSSMVLHHCMPNGRPFTMMFRRQPIPLRRREKEQFKKLLKSQELPEVYRESTVCLTCRISSAPFLVFLNFLQLLLCYKYYI